MKLMLKFLNKNTCTYKHLNVILKWNVYAHVVIKVKCRHILCNMVLHKIYITWNWCESF